MDLDNFRGSVVINYTAVAFWRGFFKPFLTFFLMVLGF